MAKFKFVPPWAKWKGFELVKLLKGNDICTVVTNIETLILKAGIRYKLAYDPDTKQWFLVIG